MRKPLPVSEHAVLRWLERECGVPVERIRQLIGEGCAPYANFDPVNIKIGKTKFVVSGGKVVTTLGKDMPHPARRSEGEQ